MPARATMRITSQVTTPHGQRAHHRSREGRRQRLERDVGAERANRLLLSVQIALERMLDRRVTERLQRAEVVAHRRDVGLSGIGQLPESHAFLAALGEQVQRGIHQSRPRPQTGFATLIHPR